MPVLRSMLPSERAALPGTPEHALRPVRRVRAPMDTHQSIYENISIERTPPIARNGGVGNPSTGSRFFVLSDSPP